MFFTLFIADFNIEEECVGDQCERLCTGLEKESLKDDSNIEFDGELMVFRANSKNINKIMGEALEYCSLHYTGLAFSFKDKDSFLCYVKLQDLFFLLYKATKERKISLLIFTATGIISKDEILAIYREYADNVHEKVIAGLL